MTILPAIDLKGGKCVRLRQGRADDVTVYGDDPAAQARDWREQGGRELHVVDLDGAFAGEPRHAAVIAQVIEAFGGKGFSAATPQEFEEAFRQALQEDGPVWIDCKISPDERVLPMIPGGGTLEDMIIG